MIKTAYILPTGDELLEGVILDTDSPMIMETLLGLSGSCRVIREEPLADRQQEIVGKIRQCSLKGADLLVFIGGSGGGHRHSPTLGKDFTHSAMEECLNCAKVVSLYGKNGHLWSRLVCGFYGKTMVINVPGPYSEAKAAISAFCSAYRKAGADMTQISRAMAKAVESQYPQGSLKQSQAPEESLGQSQNPEERLEQSRTPEESLGQSQNPEERLGESQTPEERLEQSRTPEERLEESRTPEERLEHSQTPEESPASESDLPADLSRRDS